TSIASNNSANVCASYPTTATAASAVGGYPITATLAYPGSKLGNYTVTNPGGTLTVLYSIATCQGSAGHTILQPINADNSSVFKRSEERRVGKARKAWRA